MRQARLLVIQHDADTPLGELAGPLVDAGIQLDTWPTWAMRTPRWDVDEFDGVVSLGSVDSVTALERIPWIRDEIGILEAALGRGLPILGVCFGSQSLARAAGGVVRRAVTPEIGWHAVVVNDMGCADPVIGTLGEGLQAMQYHYDTVVLPKGVGHVLATGGGMVQAFRVGARAWGVQFHIEASPSVIQAWIATLEDEMQQAGVDLGSLRQQTQENWRMYRDRAWAMGSAFAREVNASVPYH